jgi:hypothetical protein
VIAFATLPFSEGKRRARAGGPRAPEWSGKRRHLFDNDRMGAGRAESWNPSRHFRWRMLTITKSRSIVNLISAGVFASGLMICWPLRSQGGRCLFGFGESDSI